MRTAFANSAAQQTKSAVDFTLSTMPTTPDSVRPTRRCLDDLEIVVPDIGVKLHDLEHPLIMRAQQIPERVVAGGAERIVSLADRVWFKVKTSDWRGAVGRLPPLVPTIDHCWWLAAAGHRTADSDQHDFYARLSVEATSSSDVLLPSQWDADRLLAEATLHAANIVQGIIRSAAGQSLKHGDIRGVTIGSLNVRVRISARDDQRVYMVIGAIGNLDRGFLLMVLSAFPGVSAEDWMPEPTDELDLHPMDGEILWSAMITPKVQAVLLDAAEDDAD